MRISEILKLKPLTISFEVFPPKVQPALKDKSVVPVTAETVRGLPVAKTVRELSAFKPDFISVTYGAGGSTRGYTAEIALEVEKCGVPALAHLTCIGSSRSEIDEGITALKTRGIQNVLALRGDIPEKKTTIAGFAHASDLVPVLKTAGFCVGAACYPEGHPESKNRDADLDNLKLKADSGVDFLTTQMFFDNDMFYNFLYRLRSKGIEASVLAGIMPITNAGQIKRTVALSNAYIPRKLLAIFDRFGESPEALYQAGIAYAVDQIIDLISNGVKGIHIYTMNKSSIAGAIIAAVDKIVAGANLTKV
jgi:methylenetetrahydrofolate reductase (NADPH)